MKKGWTTTKLMATGSLAVLSLILSLLGAPLTSLTGMPGGSGLINALHGATLSVLTVMVIQSFGAQTVRSLAFSILAIPLPLLGVSGFLPKIIIGLASGLVTDITYYLSRKSRRFSAVVVGFISQLSQGMGIFFLGKVFGVPGIERVKSIYSSASQLLFTVLFLTGFIILGLFGLLGLVIYEKIESTAVVRRIQQ